MYRINSFFSLFMIFIVQNACSQKEIKNLEWQTMSTTNAPIARHENGFVEVAGKFYLIGGRGIKPVSIYDTKTNSWITGKEPMMEIHHFQGVSYKGKIYVIGAMTGKYPYETPLSNMLIYSPDEDQWEIGPEIPENRRRGSCGVVVVNEKVFMVSGIVDGHNSKHVPWVDVYDFKKETWTILPDAPRSRDHFHAVFGEGKIYAVGGRNSSYATKQTFELTIPEIDVFDLKTSTWKTIDKTHNLPTERAGTSTIFWNNKLIIIGGESVALEEAHENVEIFNILSNKWEKYGSLKRGRHGTQAILHKDTIYIVAGSGNRGGKPELDTMEKIVLKK